MDRKFFIIPTSILSTLISFNISAYAQTIDYSTMETLFGEPVTTSGNGSPQKQSQVSLNMEIVTDEDIKNSGARNIPEAIRHISGVDVRQHSMGQYEVAIRGYNQPDSERILVLLNGRQVYLDNFGMTIWGNIPVEMSEIKQIEVIKGPNTALFGFNAVSGVVNIITYNPLYDNKKHASMTMGTQGIRKFSGTATTKLNEKVGLRLSAGASRASDDFDDLSANGLEIKDTKRESILGDIWIQMNDQTQLNLEIGRNSHQRNEKIVTLNSAATEYNTNSYRAKIISDNQYGLMEADIYHNDSSGAYTLVQNNSKARNQLDYENSITVAKLSNTFSAGDDHVFRVSGEYRGGKNFYTTPNVALDADKLQTENWGLSSLWDWRVTDKFRTSSALRYDNLQLKPENGKHVSPTPSIAALNPYTDAQYKQKITEWSYNLGAVYTHDDRNTFRGTIARGIDLPSFTEFGLQFVVVDPPAPVRGIYGNPNTEPSIVYNYELGYEHKIAEIGALFDTAVFYQYNDEMQAFASSIASLGANSIETIGNIGDSEMYGAEISADFAVNDQFSWNIGYSYITINDQLRNQKLSNNLYSTPTNYEDSYSTNMLNLGARYSSSNWRASVLGQYRQGYAALRPVYGKNFEFQSVDVNDHYIVNIHAAYDFNENVTWTLAGTNMIGGAEQTLGVDVDTIVTTSLNFNF